MNYRAEDGNTTVLSLGYLLLGLLLLAMLSYHGEVQLSSRQLHHDADSAARATAQAAAQGITELTQDGRFVVNTAKLRAEAEHYLSRSGASSRHHRLEVSEVKLAADGRTVIVKLTAISTGPVMHVMLPAHIELEAEARSRVSLSR